MTEQKIAILGVPDPGFTSSVAAALAHAAPGNDLPLDPPGGEVPPEAEELFDSQELAAAQQAANDELMRTAQGGEYTTMPDAAMMRSFMMQRNVQIQRQLDAEVSEDDKTMLQVASEIEAKLNQMAADGETISLAYGDFLVINRRKGNYEIEAYRIVNNPTNPLPTTKRINSWVVNRLLTTDPMLNPFKVQTKSEDDKVCMVDWVNLAPLSTLNGRSTGVLQSITIGVYNVVKSLRSAKWSIVTLCPDASELRTYKPLLITHPMQSMGLNGLLTKCKSAALSTRSRESYASYMKNVGTA